MVCCVTCRLDIGTKLEEAYPKRKGGPQWCYRCWSRGGGSHEKDSVKHMRSQEKFMESQRFVENANERRIKNDQKKMIDCFDKISSNEKEIIKLNDKIDNMNEQINKLLEMFN